MSEKLSAKQYAEQLLYKPVLPPFRCSFLRPSIPHSAPKANDLCIACPGRPCF